VDFLEIIFWIVFLLAPFVTRMVKKRKGARRLREQSQSQSQPQSRSQAQSRSQPHPQLQSVPDRDVERRIPGNDPTPERQLTPFQEALRQIQDTMAEARETAAQQATPAAVVPPTPTTSGRAQRHVEPPRSALSSQAQRPVDPPRSAFSFRGADSQTQKPTWPAEPDPYKDSSYDDDFEARAPYDESFHETVHSHARPSAKEPEQRKSKPSRSKWQQAYVMSEILKPPRSRAPWRSRMSQ